MDLSEFYDNTTMKRVISNYEDEMLDAPPCKKREVINDEVASTADRIGISNPQATLLIGAVLRSVGLNADDYTFSVATLRRKRIEFRAKFAAQLKKDLNCANVLVLHWDGKILPKVDGQGKVDRLPIVVTGIATEQLLGAPELEAGTGEKESEALLQTIEQWNLSTKIRAFCFDTTASNTGEKIFTNGFMEF